MGKTPLQRFSRFTLTTPCGQGIPDVKPIGNSG
jgi:hypothetical protein